jgi:glycosyltransferase involved in cell wall biosynthesis
MPSRPLRILFVSHARKDPNGGASRVFHLLEDGLSARGHEVVAIHRDDLTLTQRLGKLADRFLLPQTISIDARRYRPQDFDVVMAPSGILYPLFRQLRDRPTRPLLVQHLLGSMFFDHFATVEEAARGHLRLSPVYRLMTGNLPLGWDLKGARAADLLTVNCGRDLDYMIDQGIPPANCVHIPLALHPDILAHAMAERPRPSRTPRSVFWFGSWSDRKGISYLPRAWRLIRERFPDATLTLGATGMPAAVLHDAFAPEDRASVTVLGRISVAEQLAAFDSHAVFLFPSLSEGFGFALLEAMAGGLAPVATLTGMGADFLRDRDNAMVIPPASSLHMAKAVITLLADDALRTRIGAQAACDARQLTATRMIDAYETLFLDGLDRRERPATPEISPR